MEKLTKMYVQMQTKLQDQKGATLVEYGLMVALIAAICVGIVTTLGTQVQAAFQTVSDAL